MMLLVVGLKYLMDFHGASIAMHHCAKWLQPNRWWPLPNFCRLYSLRSGWNCWSSFGGTSGSAIAIGPCKYEWSKLTKIRGCWMFANSWCQKTEIGLRISGDVVSGRLTQRRRLWSPVILIFLAFTGPSSAALREPLKVQVHTMDSTRINFQATTQYFSNIFLSKSQLWVDGELNI